MKKVFAFLLPLIIFSATGIGQVQRQGNPSQSSQSNASQKDKKKNMMKELNLTKEQRGQMKEFHSQMKQKKDAINNDNTLTEAQKKDKMQEIHKEQKEKLKAILTSEQKEKLREQRKNSKMKPDISNETLPPVKKGV